MSGSLFQSKEYHSIYMFKKGGRPGPPSLPVVRWLNHVAAYHVAAGVLVGWGLKGKQYWKLRDAINGYLVELRNRDVLTLMEGLNNNREKIDNL